MSYLSCTHKVTLKVIIDHVNSLPLTIYEYFESVLTLQDPLCHALASETAITALKTELCHKQRPQDPFSCVRGGSDTLLLPPLLPFAVSGNFLAAESSAMLAQTQYFLQFQLFKSDSNFSFFTRAPIRYYNFSTKKPFHCLFLT